MDYSTSLPARTVTHGSPTTASHSSPYCHSLYHESEHDSVITARSEVRKVLLFGAISLWFFVCVRNISGTAERICTAHGRRVRSLAQMSLKVKIKGQRSRSPGTKTAFFSPFGGLRAVYVW